ncbi:hypothetical protein EfmJHP10_11590 [Enterococcus faecium]|nr:hypothetical protein EfmJHP10_11590 [Enterococcus faecium]
MSKKNGFPNDEIPKSNLLRKLKFLYSGNHLLISCALYVRRKIKKNSNKNKIFMSKKNGFPNDEIPKSNLLRKLKLLVRTKKQALTCAARNAFPGVGILTQYIFLFISSPLKS